MAAALDDNGSKYEFVRYKDKGHLGVSEDVIQKTLDFISNQIEAAKPDMGNIA